MIGGRGCCTGFGQTSGASVHCRVISASWRSSSSSRSRDVRNGKPYVWCSASNQPAPIPSSTRPFEMWSTVDDGLREHRGGAERDRGDHRAESQPFRSRGERGERRPGVERAGRVAAHDRAVVVGAEEAVEAGGFGGGREREPLLPLDALLALEHQADAHHSGVT